jgi:hypothetical protein
MLSLLLASSAASNPFVIALGVLYFIFIVYCAFKTAQNGHWLFFILGFFCGGIFWIIGAVLGPKNRI